MSSNGDRSFQIAFSQATAETIRRLQRQASSENRGQQFFRALLSAARRLRVDPTNFGEPLYRLPALELEVRTAVVRLINVDFAVSESRRLVFIKAVRLL
jgi:hypothetical protein